MKIGIYPYGPIDAIMYVVEGSEHSYIIDPCVALSEIQQPDTPYKGILITHCHYDHINRMEEIRNALDVKVYAHAFEFPSFSDTVKSGAAFFMSDEIFDTPDYKINEGDTFSLDPDSYIKALHTPGHTIGGLSFLLFDKGKLAAIFTGDTIFKGSAGRTDLGGDPVQLDRSLRILASFENDVMIYPGHGAKSTVGYEKANNPFLVRAMKSYNM
ncbi:MAG: MBL fold metallo-hydrolase [Eubacteriales bacterium]|nr:MBL fold metallo-hydrolase [Eubacteriales bacterium]MDD4326889.1 MBL fold metallo-hydrolase [Eubacteriales bacterium]MDD4716828.1 MBL fold metallo-hydrolase [Eubacteriales bacterium]NCU27255.1 MBL fold metallo-hydrolase [Candidatus Nomurabacteria bacterium]